MIAIPPCACILPVVYRRTSSPLGERIEVRGTRSLNACLRQIHGLGRLPLTIPSLRPFNKLRGPLPLPEGERSLVPLTQDEASAKVTEFATMPSLAMPARERREEPS